MPGSPRAMRRWPRLAWRALRWLFASAVVVVALLCVPVAYVELSCRGALEPQPYRSLVATEHRRPEANTYLTYPEWHIVYAYDGLAATLKTGDEYQFPFYDSVSGFWRSTCAAMRVADAHGGADGATRAMIHIIGTSFTFEMAVKALYEETVGRAAAWWRGPEKTPQDLAVQAMAANYSAFLRQTPWYEFPFGRERRALWAAPVTGVVRGWERRLGIGTEFLTKSVYAGVLGAAAGTAPATLTIRTVVGGLDRKRLSAMPDVTVVGDQGADLEIETPRYDLYTRILTRIAREGGTLREIAGNDDIMVTVTVPADAFFDPAPGRALLRMHRSGIDSDRLLIALKVRDLAPFLIAHPLGDPGVEHIFDF